MPDAASEPAVNTISQLIRIITDKHLPAFASTLKNVFRATDSDSTTGQQIAQIILRDSALTSRVLCAANAANLGYGAHTKIATVSRAVVVLGVNALRSLCVSAAVVESMSGPRQFRDRVRDALARALHSAFQARDIGVSEGLGPEAVERLFIESLLSHIGEIAFWCYGEEFAVQMDAVLRVGTPTAEAAREVLGRSFQQFGRDLLQIWKLDFVLQNSPEVGLANRLSSAAAQGWGHPTLQNIVTEISQLYRLSGKDTCERLQRNAEAANQMAIMLGIEGIQELLPDHAVAETIEDIAEEGQGTQYPEPDFKLQMRALTELGKVAQSRKDLPLLLETCLEGIYRAVGLDRAAICLINPDRTLLSARIVVGHQANALHALLNWPLTAQSLRALQPDLRCWRQERTKHSNHPKNPMESALSFLFDTLPGDALLATFSVDNRPIGILYADREPSGRALDADAFEGFKSFVEQTEMVMRSLRRA